MRGCLGPDPTVPSTPHPLMGVGRTLTSLNGKSLHGKSLLPADLFVLRPQLQVLALYLGQLEGLVRVHGQAAGDAAGAPAASSGLEVLRALWPSSGVSLAIPPETLVSRGKPERAPIGV